jgi:ABC-2 type transport system permease protein
MSVARSTAATTRRAGYVHSLWLLARRDLLVRYSTSVLGYLWSIIDPLIMSAIYYFVFVVVFQRADVGFEPYIVFLLSGLLPWVWFNGTVSDATRAFWKEGRLVRSVNIPRTIWVNQLVLAKGIEFIASLPVLVAFALFTGAQFHWQIVLWIPAIIMQALLTMGVGLIVAPIVVFFRDLERVTKLILRFLFYASPIVYAASALPEGLHVWAGFNPLFGLMSLYRSAFFPDAFDPYLVGMGVAMTALLLAVGYSIFRRTERALLKEV